MLSPKVNFLDIFIISPQYFNKKVWGRDKRICSLMLEVKRVSRSLLRIRPVCLSRIAALYVATNYS